MGNRLLQGNIILYQDIEEFVMPQPYPRITDEDNRYHSCLDTSFLQPHLENKISPQRMEELFISAIQRADQKSSRVFFKVPEDATLEQTQGVFYHAGVDLFDYFKKYYGDPPVSAIKVSGKDYKEVAMEHLMYKQIQRGRMNSGWRYQYFVVDCARECARFISVGDIGTTEGDFSAVVGINNWQFDTLNLYVSVKNRSNTMGGQDWPGAINGIETLARHDRNRVGPYICIFGIAMDITRSERRIPKTKDGHTRSSNTEVWMSNFFWPFFTNYSYVEIMQFALKTIRKFSQNESMSDQDKEFFLQGFKQECNNASLLTPEGKFKDDTAILDFFSA